MGMLLDRVLRLPPRTTRFVREVNVPLRTRDDVALLTDVYRPLGSPNAPTVLLRTPYGRDKSMRTLAEAFAYRDYKVVLQSCRGTYGSGGTFAPFFNEHDDGIDTVDWIERQPWFTGKLGMHGGSYMGFAQWAVAAELGNRLSAMTAVVTVSDFPRALHDGGGFRLEDFLSWVAQLQVQEKQNLAWLLLKRKLFGDPLTKRYGELPVKTLDVATFGYDIDYWRDWAQRDPADPGWNAMRFTDTIDRISAPVSLVAGWSDIFCTIQLEDFQRLRAAGVITRLKIGPWTHSSFGLLGAGFLDALEWFEWHLRGKSPADRSEVERLRFWVNGTNSWRDTTAWPPTHSRPVHWALSADGTLGEKNTATGTRPFVYDPANPTPSIAGARLAHAKGRGDVRALSARDDVLTFDAPTLDRDIEITGDVAFTLTTSAVHPHDLFACLCDVDPKGRAINITDGYRRLPPPDADRATRTTTFNAAPAAWKVKRGHHLRLLVSAGSFPRFARNLGFAPEHSDGIAHQAVNIALHCDSIEQGSVTFFCA